MARAIAIRQHAEHAGRAVRAAVTGVQAKDRKRVVLASLLILLSIGGTVGLLTNFGRTPRAAYGQERSGAECPVECGGCPSLRRLDGEIAPSDGPLRRLRQRPWPMPHPCGLDEVFGFAPYWTLSQSGGFNVSGISTLAYFSIDVNADGSLDKSGAGWAGYQSQDLANLVTRAHGVGRPGGADRQLLRSSTRSTRSPPRPRPESILSTALIAAIESEESGRGQSRLRGRRVAPTRPGSPDLVTQVSAAIHAVNPHYQVTMDTYASSAGDSERLLQHPRPGARRSTGSS